MGSLFRVSLFRVSSSWEQPDRYIAVCGFMGMGQPELRQLSATRTSGCSGVYKGFLATRRALGAVVWATTWRAMTGFALASLAGLVLGLMAGLSHTLGRALEPVSTVLLGIPPIAWIVLAILWFGSGSMAAIYTVAATTLPVTFAGAQIGARTLDKRLQEMGDVYRVPGWMRLWDFYLPHIVSYVFPALITAWA